MSDILTTISNGLGIGKQLYDILGSTGAYPTGGVEACESLDRHFAQFIESFLL